MQGLVLGGGSHFLYLVIRLALAPGGGFETGLLSQDLYVGNMA